MTPAFIFWGAFLAFENVCLGHRHGGSHPAFLIPYHSLSTALFFSTRKRSISDKFIKLGYSGPIHSFIPFSLSVESVQITCYGAGVIKTQAIFSQVRLYLLHSLQMWIIRRIFLLRELLWSQQEREQLAKNCSGVQVPLSHHAKWHIQGIFEQNRTR